MKLKELLEILDSHVELEIFDRNGLHVKHFYDEDDQIWSNEFLEKEIIEIDPFVNFGIFRKHSIPPASLAIYLEDYYDTHNTK